MSWWACVICCSSHYSITGRVSTIIWPLGYICDLFPLSLLKFNLFAYIYIYTGLIVIHIWWVITRRWLRVCTSTKDLSEVMRWAVFVYMVSYLHDMVYVGQCMYYVQWFAWMSRMYGKHEIVEFWSCYLSSDVAIMCIAICWLFTMLI